MSFFIPQKTKNQFLSRIANAIFLFLNVIFYSSLIFLHFCFPYWQIFNLRLVYFLIFLKKIKVPVAMNLPQSADMHTSL